MMSFALEQNKHLALAQELRVIMIVVVMQGLFVYIVLVSVQGNILQL